MGGVLLDLSVNNLTEQHTIHRYGGKRVRNRTKTSSTKAAEQR